MNNLFTNILVVVVLVLLVGFGVWYFTMREAAEPAPEGGIELNVGTEAEGAY